MNEAEVFLYNAKKGRWRCWALFIAVLLFAAAGCYAWRWLEARRFKAGVFELPKQEMAVTDDVAGRLRSVIEEARSERYKLPEVIDGAKDDVRRDVAGLDNDGVAGRWNGLLGRYRENRAAAEGVFVDQ